MDVNPHLARAPVAAGHSLADARMVGVLVHGRDQDECTMLDVVERLRLDDVGYVLPVAANRSWYPGRYFDPVTENEPYLSWAIEACQAALATARAAGVPDQRIVLGGFSQGACVVAELLARGSRPIAGAAVLTGSLLGRPADRTPAPLDGLPMFFALSSYDEWIALADAQATARAFERMGADVVFEIYEDREHHISDQAVAGLRTLLTPR
jgi:phospholipase/carboxylesterase